MLKQSNQIQREKANQLPDPLEKPALSGQGWTGGGGLQVPDPSGAAEEEPGRALLGVGCPWSGFSPTVSSSPMHSRQTQSPPCGRPAAESPVATWDDSALSRLHSTPTGAHRELVRLRGTITAKGRGGAPLTFSVRLLNPTQPQGPEQVRSQKKAFVPGKSPH